jgi:hypothetical protein
VLKRKTKIKILIMPSSGTSNFNRRGIMKKSILIVLASILLSYPISLMGADFETPHEFKSGDTISAEMMNEIFNYIKEKNSGLTMNKLIGNWSCEKFVNGEVSTWTNSSAHYSTVGTDNLWRSINLNLEFKDDGDGTFSWSSTGTHAFYLNYNDDDICDATGQLSLYNNLLKTKGPTCLNAGYPTTFTRVFRVLVKTKNRIIIEYGTERPTLWCDKLNLVPSPPSNLTYALPADNSSSSITLTWTDSNTEAVTGYKVNRKTVVTDNFTTVSTITDNTTRTYADTNVTESGKYWYRVLAYNTNGDGTPSKVVKASFPDDEAPTGTLKIDNATTTTTSSSVTLNLTATDNKGVVGYLASESSAPPSTDSTSWVSITSTTSYSADVSFTLSSGYGVKFVYVWFKDGKGNIAGYGASINYSSQ